MHGAMTTRNGALQASSSGTLIYASNTEEGTKAVILDYPSGELLASFQPPIEPEGACSDTQGDVYLSGGTISGAASIVEYTYGATSPSASANLPGDVARDCTVDNTTGNVAAITYYSHSGQIYSVAVLPKFQSPANIYNYPAMLLFDSVGYDGSGNLFLLGTTSGGNYALAELPSGGSSFEPILLNLGESIAKVRTVQWDGKYLAIEATKVGQGQEKHWPQVIYRLTVSGSKAKVVGTIRFKGLRGVESGTSWIQADRNIMVFARGPIPVWGYPGGGKQLAKLRSGIDQGMHLATVAASSSYSQIQKH
ncbi:MAG TPA: hypothetical protein VNU22_12575 [Candidatus Acidoferrum sp.]|jgi:hypothetical protein|nr:hypothetical protein [Candidatus Acidoferrum sp.]